MRTRGRLTCFLVGLLAAGCPSSPMPPDAARPDAGAAVDGGGTQDGGADAGVCGSCDDGVDCTIDSCVAGLCEHAPDASRCADGDFCNGDEVCDASLGCRYALRGPCNDEDTCTQDACDPVTETCSHVPRDVDDDGDPEASCGGGDCDDVDPMRSSTSAEICSDGIDNDCDGELDELDCVRVPHDTCDDPLDVSTGGLFLLNTRGAAPDHALGCRSTTRDLVARFTLTERRSITIEGRGDFFTVALSLRTTCTDRASEVDCQSGFPGVIRRRALDPGTYYIVVAASSTGEIGLSVTFGPPMDPPTNDTCATPIDVSAGGRFAGSTVETTDDYTTSCGLSGTTDLTYTFTTTAEQDVRISALSATGGSMVYSLRSDCTMESTALRCDYGDPAVGTIHQVPAGTYFIVVEGPGSRAVDFMLDVAFLAPTPPLPGDTCSNPIVLTPDGTSVAGTFVGMENDHNVTCGFRYRDVVYEFTLAAAADVTVNLDAGLFANVSTRPTCDDSTTQIRCTSGNPVRQRIRNLAAGTYYLIGESSRGTAFNVSVQSNSPPSVPIPVLGNNTCSAAEVIPSTGGLFTGNTSTHTNSVGGTACGAGANSPDAAYQLTLASRSRVVAATEGSTYDTVLHIHQTMCTSAGELFCDDDAGAGSTSLIDQMLDPGVYFIIVDGFGTTSSGAYTLEVAVTP